MAVVYHVPKRATVHCTATPNGKRVNVEAIREDHMKNRGWSDIGYHMIIQPDGEVANGRPLNIVGAHVEGDNIGNLGIAMAGTDLFSIEQFNSLAYKLQALKQGFNIPLWEVYTHNQFKSAIAQGKRCPCISINHLLGFLMTQVREPIQSYLYR